MARLSTAVGSVVHQSASRSPGLFTKAIISLAICLAICLTAGLLVAQAPPDDTPVREETDEKGFKVQVPSESLTKGPKARSTEQSVRSSVRKILNGDSLNANAATRRNFRNYFRQYLFPVMTTEEGLKNVSNDRILFLRDVQSHRNNEAHTELINLTLPAMRQIVEDPAYRLAARYNAMLIISSLNDVEPSANPPVTLPEPMQLALPVIYQQFKKADNHDSIRIAALIGLSRHLEWDNYKGQNSPRIPPAARVEIIKELTSLAEAKQPPEGRDADVHNWMRRRAIEGLALACLTTPDAGITATMEKLVKDDADTLNIRTTAANMFGRMSLQPPIKVDPVALAKDLGYVALVACDAELTKAEANRKTEAEREARLMGTYSGDIDYSGAGGTGGPGGMMRSGGMSGEGIGGMGGPRAPVRPQAGLGTDGGSGGEYGLGGTGIDPSMMDPKQYRVEYLRRKLRQHLFAVQQGLVGNDDHAPPKTTGNSGKTPTPPTTKTGPTDGTPAAEKKGLFNVAKTKPEQEGVDAVYFNVRRLAEIVEVAGAEADFYQLVKDLRKELQTLEVITKRLPPAGGAAPAAATAIDAPSMPAGPGKAGPAKGKAAPVKTAPPPAGKGKAASRPLPSRQPAVFGKPRAGR
jgi:hypothetical protein